MCYIVAYNWRLTTPFWTLKPSWYLVSGLLIFTSTTGGQETAVSFTTVLVLVFCKNANIVQCSAVQCSLV